MKKHENDKETTSCQVETEQTESTECPKSSCNLKVRTGLKAGFFFIRRGSVGGRVLNRCETVVRGRPTQETIPAGCAKPSRNLKVRTGVKAGFFFIRRGSVGGKVLNRCETVVGRRPVVRPAQ